MTSAQAKVCWALAGLITVLGTVTGCGGHGLSGSSTCKDFMNATPDAQTQVVNELATKYHKSGYTTPLGRPEIPYYCGDHPDTTLDQFFQTAQ